MRKLYTLDSKALIALYAACARAVQNLWLQLAQLGRIMHLAQITARSLRTNSPLSRSLHTIRTQSCAHILDHFHSVNLQLCPLSTGPIITRTIQEKGE
jgi:hypothetical protein